MARYILPNKPLAYLVIYTGSMGVWEYGSMGVWEYEFNLTLLHSHTLTLS